MPRYAAAMLMPPPLLRLPPCRSTLDAITMPLMLIFYSARDAVDVDIRCLPNGVVDTPLPLRRHAAYFS